MAKRSKRARVDGAESRQRVAFRLGAEAVRRLRVACAMEGRAPNALVERLILDHGRRWVVQDRGGEPGQDVPAA